MDDQSIEQEIQAKGLTAPRITPDHIDALMARISYIVHCPMDTTSTFVHAYLDGKFYLASGHSACVSPENFDADVGYQIARSKADAVARDKLWELEGFRLYQSIKEKQ